MKRADIRQPFWVRVCLLLVAVCLWLGCYSPALARPATRDWEAVDRAALSTPAASEQSIPVLAAYLSRRAHSSEEKARIAYRWVTDRIRYDVEGLKKHNAPQDGVTCLRRRMGTCAGYSDLYILLLQEMGLDCFQIVGDCKGYGFDAESASNRDQRHGWAAVKLPRGWILVDPTWGAGSLSTEMTFRKKFQDYWFDVAPSEMIYSHFPDDKRWQLLSSPWSQETFARAVRVTPEYFRYRIELLAVCDGAGRATSQRANDYRIALDSNGELRLKVTGPGNLRISATVDGGGSNLIHRKGQQFEVLVRGSSAKSTLRLFATTQTIGRARGIEDSATTAERKLDWVCEYSLQAASSRGSVAAYPKTYGSYQEQQAELISPLTATLSRNRKVRFKIRVPNADAVQVSVDKERFPLSQRGQDFEGDLSLPAGQATIFAHYPDASSATPGSRRFWGLVQYQVQ